MTLIFARKTEVETYCSGEWVNVLDGDSSDVLKPQKMNEGHFLGSYVFNGKIRGFDPRGSRGKAYGSRLGIGKDVAEFLFREQ